MDTRTNSVIEFTSSVHLAMREVVERLFFFNPRQSLHQKSISAEVAHTGVPEIIEGAGRIWINVPSDRMQCLFACESSESPRRPLGVSLYYRPNEVTITISHLAVDASSVESRAGIGQKLIERIRDIAHSISGVERIELPYRRNHYLSVDRRLIGTDCMQ